MIGKKLPQNLLSGLALGICVGAVLLAMFYAQYRWLASELVNTSAAEHEVVLRESFERRFRARLHELADQLAVQVQDASGGPVAEQLETMLAENSTLLGLRAVIDGAEAVQVGTVPLANAGETVWLSHSITMSYPLLDAEQQLGQLVGAFLLDELRAESAAFGPDEPRALLLAPQGGITLGGAWGGRGRAPVGSATCRSAWARWRRWSLTCWLYR